LTSETLPPSSTASSSMPVVGTFADSLTNIMAAAAASNPMTSRPCLEEPVRGRSEVRCNNKAPGQKSYSCSPTSEASSDIEQSGMADEYELPEFLRHGPEEIQSSPLLHRQKLQVSI
jgi:hypothetical protein